MLIIFINKTIFISRRLQWAENVARMGGTSNGYKTLAGTILENGHLEDQEGWRITLGWMFGR